MPNKNLIFICADQMRYDALSVNGNPVVATQNIDGIAARGKSLPHHHTPNQICSPSRATMATGMLPRRHRLWRNGVALDERVPTLWSHLQASGFRTGAAGKLHYQPLLAPSDAGMPESLAYWDKPEADDWHGPYFGFDHVDLVLGEAHEVVRAGHYANWLRRHHPHVASLYQPDAVPGSQAGDLQEVWRSAVPPPLHYTNWIADRAIDFIRGSDESPFALFVSFPDPHHPFSPPGEYADLFAPAAMPSPCVRPGELDRMPAYLQFGDDPSKEAYIGPGEAVREQGFMLRTDTISQATLARAIAHTYGMIKMIDDAVGRIMAALGESGADADTIVLFTADHGEFLGDHGLLRKGPPPYTQLLHVPLCIRGPDVDALPADMLTSHHDLAATLSSLLGAGAFGGTDGIDLTDASAASRRDCLFAEYHPRKDAALYNQTIITDRWRFTHYPNRPGWAELFDRAADPGEHWNLAGEPSCADVVSELAGRLAKEFPPQPDVAARVWGAY